MGMTTQLWMIVILIMFQGWWCNCCLEEERIALLQFKASIPDRYFDVLVDWVEGGDCCNWTRIICNTTTRRVIEIDVYIIREITKDWYLNASLFLPLKELRNLEFAGSGLAGCVQNGGFERLSVLNNLESIGLDYNNLDGNILSSLSTLSSLKKLYFASNKIKGYINIEELNNLTNLKELSFVDNAIEGFKSFKGEEEILKLKNLEYLDISYNFFDSNIFSHLSGLSSLKILRLGGNQQQGSTKFTGFQKLSVLNNLEDLDLSCNDLDASVLSSLGTISSLKKLYLNDNKIKGSIHIEEINNLTSLKVLDLKNNRIQRFRYFQGEDKNLKLKSLEYLDLSNNLFDTDIFSHFSRLSSLIYLHLERNQLKGPINITELNALYNLKELFLDSNEINQFVASAGTNEGLLRLSNLQSLVLSNNRFDIRILSSIRELLSLRKLWLDTNQLKGSLNMEVLGNLSNLEDLILVRNKITGIVHSKGPFNLINLKVIDLSNNNLEGATIYQGICQLKSLEVLYADNNNLNWELPPCLGNLTSLQDLTISSNYLSGHIPSFMGEIQSLLWLDLSNNHLQGDIPFALSNCSSLLLLNLNNNNLFGRIPEWIGSLSNLGYLGLSQNYFFGTLPNNFNLPLLQYLYLSKNNIRGSLTNIFYNCYILITLDISHNNLSGKISDRIGLLSSLNFLLLSYNNFEGEMPIELCKLDQLRLIDLSNNNFSGHIQPCMRPSSYIPNDTDSVSVEYQSLEITTKNASYPYHGTILDYISGIDLSCNNLNGEIPHEYGNLNYIKLLNLSHNSLVGEIPQTFSNLKEIETLDLSFNNLNGLIPPQLTELYYLSSFSVAHNNLSGKTPERVAQFATFEETSYRGNKFLCGPPLRKICGENKSLSLPKSDIVSERNNDLLDMNAFWVTFVVSYVLAFFIAGVLFFLSS